jgi:pimeloyl-ACP methyl ester carboxylesterase
MILNVLKDLERMLKYFNVESTKISCWINSRDFGKHRQSMVFIHGSGSDHSVWSNQYAKLHKDYNILAIDLPGHGQSEGEAQVTIEDYCRWVKNLLDVANLPNTILVGHSLGAAITLTFAINYPKKLSGIVAVGGGIKMPVNAALLEGLKANPAETMALICKFSLAKENREKFLAALIESKSLTRVDVLRNDLLACDKLNLTQELNKISSKALVICGVQDKMTSPDNSREIAANINGAKLTLIEGAGHMVMLEKPLEFNEELKNFAQQLFHS